MTWFKVDDQWASHPKVRRAGKDGRALWTAAGTKCAALNSDGIVEDLVVAEAAFLAEVNGKKASAALVAAGLWHDDLKLCARCRDRLAAGRRSTLDAGSFYFHDWLDYQPSKDEATIPIETRRRQRESQLKQNRQLRAQIQERDGSHCRYCAQRVSWTARRGERRATYDHVDPDGWNELDNVVTACGACNGEKKDRTPEEWFAEDPEHGHLLLSAPRRRSELGSSPLHVVRPDLGPDLEGDLDHDLGTDLDHDPGRTQVATESELSPTRAPRARGAGPRSDPGLSQVEPGRAGAGRVGQGRPPALKPSGLR